MAEFSSEPLTTRLGVGAKGTYRVTARTEGSAVVLEFERPLKLEVKWWAWPILWVRWRFARL